MDERTDDSLIKRAHELASANKKYHKPLQSNEAYEVLRLLRQELEGYSREKLRRINGIIYNALVPNPNKQQRPTSSWTLLAILL